MGKYFPEKTKSEIITEILNDGIMQISTKEREAMQEEKEKSLIEIVSKKLVHPVSKKRYSKETIESALKDIAFNVAFNKDVK